jgi:hypothetical protein
MPTSAMLLAVPDPAMSVAKKARPTAASTPPESTCSIVLLDVF